MGLGLSDIIPTIIYATTPLALALTIFYKVEVGFIYLMPLIPLETVRLKIEDLPQGHNLFDFLLLAVLIKTFLTGKIREALDTPISKPIVLLGLLSVFSLFIGAHENPISFNNRNFLFWKNFIIMPLLFVLTYCNIDSSDKTKFFIFLMTLSLLASDFNFYTTFQWLKGEHYYHKMRFSTLENLGPNEMAALIAQSTVMVWGILVFVKDKKWLIYFTFCILVNSYVLLYSFSRSGYLSFLTGIAFLGLLKKRVVLVMLLLFMLVWTAVLPNAVIERIKMTYSVEGELDHASAARVNVWSAGFEALTANPFGIGFLKFGAMGVGEENARDAHNMFLKIAVEMGIQGLLIYLYLYFLAIKRGVILFRIGREGFQKGLGLGFICCTATNIVGNFFDQHWMWFSVTSYWWIYWAFVERAIAASYNVATE